jgi:3-hydroxybutyryl-CoA dehydrogenase
MPVYTGFQILFLTPEKGGAMKKFGIVGAGIMGADIAHLAAYSGFEVILFDIDENKARAAYEKIQERLKRYASKGKITIDEVGKTSSKIKLHQSINDLANADIILECVTEDVNVKKTVFKQLSKICRPGTVLASNTSSISITEIASATECPESVVGIHFLNPVRVMKLAEIIPGLKTTRETVEMAKGIIKKLGREHVESKDFPGFLLNRMLYPLINEAIFLLYEGAGTPEAIDKTTRIGLNLPMGPLALADMIGLDVLLAVGEEMYNGFSDPKYRPCPLLKKYVAGGYLGVKTKRGFYIY